VNGLSSNLAPEIVACIGEGKALTLQELGRVADRMRTEVYHSSLPSCGDRMTNGRQRLLSYRLALVALIGVPHVEEAIPIPA
jgi:hypothetical protein